MTILALYVIPAVVLLFMVLLANLASKPNHLPSKSTIVPHIIGWYILPNR